MKQITIIGGGPAALMLAAQLDTEKYQVTLYEKKKTVGRKFLVAGEGGLNLTYHAPLEDFIVKYFPSDFMEAAIRQFTNEDLMAWLGEIGVSTFVGSSNRVFPEQEFKPIEVLNKLVAHIKAKSVAFELGRKWEGWNEAGHLCVEGVEDVESDIVVFALGGASWKVTGADGAWREAFEERGVKVAPFRAANCAFGVNWDKQFINTHKGKPLKNIALNFGAHRTKGELVITEFGLEGNAIYALSQKLQEALLTQKGAIIHLDLKPTLTIEQIKAKYKKSRLTKPTDILKKDLKLDRSAIGLLKQFSDKDTFLNLDLLARTIKSVPITLTLADDIDKAISTLGGIELGEVDEHFKLHKIPNTYAIGEMLDWYAPTGGYLLQGCFSIGFALAKHLNGLE